MYVTTLQIGSLPLEYNDEIMAVVTHAGLLVAVTRLGRIYNLDVRS